MRAVRLLLIIALALGLAACGGDKKFRKYRGPDVTAVEVHKAARKMYLLHDTKVLKEYDMALGFAPVGHKQYEGDGKTPEGQYFINYLNPNSEYHLSLKVSYPNPMDREYAKSIDKPPGGDIFIHGGPNRQSRRGRDWTAGCVAVSDAEMEEIWSMVPTGVPVYILA